ncbi:MAG: inositol monophosphatase, partial [Coraliomargarita sp.]|nr:inositol monophosphatase [Coraliomargarita sp.]
MTLDQAALNQLADLAAQAAIRAGEYIATSSQQELEVMHKEGGDSLASQVLTEVDENAQALILEVLEPSFGKFDLALLTEESADEG